MKDILEALKTWAILVIFSGSILIIANGIGPVSPPDQATQDMAQL